MRKIEGLQHCHFTFVIRLRQRQHYNTTNTPSVTTMNHTSVEHKDSKSDATRHYQNDTTRPTIEQMCSYSSDHRRTSRRHHDDDDATALPRNTTNFMYSRYPIILLLLIGWVGIGSSPYFGNTIALRMQTYRDNYYSTNAPVS